MQLIMASSEDLTVSGKVYFLTRSPIYHEVKPYTLRYRPEDDFPQTNVARTLHNIVFRDLRTQSDLTYEKCGFKIVNLESSLSYEDYHDLNKVERVHQKEVMECVKAALKATSVEVLDYVVYCVLHIVLREALSERIGRFDDEIQAGRLRRARRIVFSSRLRLRILVRAPGGKNVQPV
jgi:hypothetical protein